MTVSPSTPRELEPGVLHFIPLGIGNAFTRYYFNSSLLLIVGGKTILIDAPAPLRRILGDAERHSGVALDMPAIDHVFLTHLHGDHCNGLEELGFWRMFLGKDQPRPVLHVHHAMREALWHERLKAAMGRLDDADGTHEVDMERYFEVRDYREGEPVDFRIEGLEAVPRMTTHMVPCAGLRLSWRGRSLGYSADTGFDPGLFEFFTDCDIIIHETGRGFGHTPLQDLLDLPADVRARLRLIHIPDDLNPATAPIEVLEQGRLYRV